MTHQPLLKLILQGDKTRAVAECARQLTINPEDLDTQRLLKQAIDLPGQVELSQLEPTHKTLVHLFGMLNHGPFSQGLHEILYHCKQGDLRRLDWLRWANWSYDSNVKGLLLALAQLLLSKTSNVERELIQRLCYTLHPHYQPQHVPEDASWSVACLIIGRLAGQVDIAISWATEARTKYPDDEDILLESARTHRDAARYDTAQQQYKTLIEIAPELKTPRLELARLSLEMGQLEQSLALYQSIVDIDPDHPTARPQAYFLRCFLTGDLIWREKLEAYSHARPKDRLSTALLKRLDRRFTAYLGYWPEPGDALIQLMKQLQPHELESDQIPDGITLNAIEAPSARRVFERFMDALLDEHKSFEVHINKVQTPDPRVPIGLVEHLLWHYDDNLRPIASYPPPSDQVTTQVHALAKQPFDITQWMQRGRLIAQNLGASSIEDLLGIMLHPTDPPQPRTPIGETLTPWRWLQRVQVAAMCILGQMGEGWHRSHRKAVLTSILLGPMDWTVEAAIVVATEIALEDPIARTDILGFFERRMHAISADAYCCEEYALISQMARLPGLSIETHAQLQKWLAIFEGPKH